MAFSDFTLKDMKTRFGLRTVETENVFATIPDGSASERLSSLIRDHYPIAASINTEKAKSELLVAPVLAEVRVTLGASVSLFSGTEFPADPGQGLTGFCDYIMCRSSEQQYIAAPVLMIAEAKNDAPKNGFGQCVAGMLGARIFNEREGTPTPVVYGAATTGFLWRFLKLEGPDVYIDLPEYHISQIGRILGILHYVMADPASTSSG